MKKRWLATGLCLAMAASMMAGCGSSSSSSSSSGSTAETSTSTTEEAGGIDISEHVDLVMYVIGSEDNSYERISEALNKKLEEDLNCSLTVKYIGFGEFNTKYGLVLSSGEQVDLIYSSSWLGWDNYIADGAYMDIADLLETYMPETCAEIDVDALKSIYNGSVYYLPANFNPHQVYGFIVPKAMREELGYTEPIDNFDDFLKVQEYALQNGYQDDLCESVHEYDLYHALSAGYTNVTDHYYVNPEDPDHEILYISEIPEVQEWLKQTEQWCNEGAWSKSVLSNTDSTRLTAGTAVTAIRNKDTWIGAYIQNPDEELEFCAIPGSMYVSPFTYEGVSVGSSSKNPERALMVLEKFRQDESYYNLITYGEEGTDYEIDSEGNITYLNSDNFTAENGTWGFRDDKFYKLQSGSPAAVEEVKETAIANEKDSPIWQFVADTDPIKNELAAVDNVYDQYYVPVSLGYVNYDSGMADLEAALSTAGNDAVKAELQSQLDAYYENMK